MTYVYLFLEAKIQQTLGWQSFQFLVFEEKHVFVVHFLEGLTPTKTLEKDDRRGFLLFNQEGFKLMQKDGMFFFGGGEQNIQIGYLYRSYIYAQKVQRPNFAHLVVSGILWSWIILMISVFFWCAQDIPKLKRSGNDLIIGWPFATFG